MLRKSADALVVPFVRGSRAAHCFSPYLPRTPYSSAPCSSPYSANAAGGDGSNDGKQGIRDDTIRDLFFSFAHPGTGEGSEPYLDPSDLGDLLGALGERVTPRRVAKLFHQVDDDCSGTISLEEFLAGHQHLLQHVGDNDKEDDSIEEGEPTDLERTLHGFLRACQNSPREMSQQENW